MMILAGWMLPFVLLEESLGLDRIRRSAEEAYDQSCPAYP